MLRPLAAAPAAAAPDEIVRPRCCCGVDEETFTGDEDDPSPPVLIVELGRSGSGNVPAKGAGGSLPPLREDEAAEEVLESSLDRVRENFLLPEPPPPAPP